MSSCRSVGARGGRRTGRNACLSCEWEKAVPLPLDDWTVISREKWTKEERLTVDQGEGAERPVHGRIYRNASGKKLFPQPTG